MLYETRLWLGLQAANVQSAELRVLIGGLACLEVSVGEMKPGVVVPPSSLTSPMRPLPFSISVDIGLYFSGFRCKSVCTVANWLLVSPDRSSHA